MKQDVGMIVKIVSRACFKIVVGTQA